MSDMPNCPNCESDLTYHDGQNFVCPMCGHEWAEAEEAASEDAVDQAPVVRDANGNVLQDGDTVIVIKDLKLSASQTIKQGTKVTGIRLVEEPVNGHDIDCRIKGIGAVMLKSEFVKK
ncbi:alkylphosphonate utilization protein [Aerococcus urinaehominis]|uniref:Alkylphosphonate utilization protein n=1 Tax=Aerococcus urinaehominis TaxID=128944 RepID=A0A0X8FM70_9LACT|nr:zinc ribbon domain-containing protein YjdM [Aerococcus urinaehominis]AMB99854.1 alkylphosphonate utilization protein [Aerococcus urinaehominis]SDM64364.1 phosphonoacetate hydrolase [Aerococcus urinaehominis]